MGVCRGSGWHERRVHEQYESAGEHRAVTRWSGARAGPGWRRRADTGGRSEPRGRAETRHSTLLFALWWESTPTFRFSFSSSDNATFLATEARSARGKEWANSVKV